MNSKSLSKINYFKEPVIEKKVLNLFIKVLRFKIKLILNFNRI